MWTHSSVSKYNNEPIFSTSNMHDYVSEELSNRFSKSTDNENRGNFSQSSLDKSKTYPIKQSIEDIDLMSALNSQIQDFASMVYIISSEASDKTDSKDVKEEDLFLAQKSLTRTTTPPLLFAAAAVAVIAPTNPPSMQDDNSKRNHMFSLLPYKNIKSTDDQVLINSLSSDDSLTNDDEFSLSECMSCHTSITFDSHTSGMFDEDTSCTLSEDSTTNQSDDETITKFNVSNSSNSKYATGTSCSSNCLNVYPMKNISVRSRSCLIEKSSYKRSNSSRVTFADSLGFELENIHYLTPPNDYLSPMMVMDSLNKNVDFLFRHTKPHRILSPLFEQPNASVSFIERVIKSTVLLEYAFSNCLSLYGSVRIKNLEFEKNIFVRYTIDEWKTKRDLKATYSHHHNDSNTDSFSFYYNFSVCSHLKKVEFAILYKTYKGDIWDNNEGNNYTLKCKYS